MKNIRNSLAIFISISILLSCCSKRLSLFNTISIQIPSSFSSDNSKENAFVNNQNGTLLSFSMIKDKSFDLLLPKIVFDSLMFEQNTKDSSELEMSDSNYFTVGERGQEVSGLRITSVEKRINNTKIKIFITEVNSEIIVGELRGDIKNADYLDRTFDQIINSIMKK